MDRTHVKGFPAAALAGAPTVGSLVAGPAQATVVTGWNDDTAGMRPGGGALADEQRWDRMPAVC
ncbi:hypothetical protein [Streptomyces sp. DH12]|uniref:hypothetical protein n=1 Tax=Streptomyces sp. DH12 TaxID=2857010 RepID=UPI001E4A6353|nr:hypothetical protein [Streptomyces sp. DH12]